MLRVVQIAVLDHRAHHIIGTLAAREAGTERAADYLLPSPYAVAASTAGRCLGVYVPPRTISAQMMRAILLASATAACRNGIRPSNPIAQGCFSGCRLACPSTAVAPMISRRRR